MNLLKLAYNVTPVRYLVGGEKAINSPNNYQVKSPTNVSNNAYNIASSPQQINELKTALGTPVISPTLIQPFTYNLQNGSRFDLQNFNGYRLPDATMFSIRQRKLIKSTKVQGGNGSVKELIAQGDYQIEFKGVIVDSDNNSYPAASAVQNRKGNQYPQSQIEAMNDLCNIPATLPVQNDLLNALGIHHIVITAFSFPNSNQFENAQLFTISALSDVPYEVRTSQGVLNPNL